MNRLKAQENFKKLLFKTYEKPKGKYHFLYESGENIAASFYADFDSDNGLELDDPNYEEYYEMVFRNTVTEELFEVTYHNIPKAAFCDGEQIY